MKLKMKIIRPVLHGFILAVVNLVSVLAAFGLYLLLRQGYSEINQIIVQGLLAAILTLVGFAAWYVIVRQLFGNHSWMTGHTEWMGAYFAALIWMPILFVPMHYLGSGYLTSVGNILATWAFQALVNLLALELVTWIRPSLAS